MNAPYKLICLVFALVFFAIAAFSRLFGPTIEPWWGHLVAAGLFFYTLSIIVT